MSQKLTQRFENIHNLQQALLSQVKGQKVSVDKSSPWNYEINLEYIIRKEKEDQRKLYNKIIPREKDIKISENNFQHVSLINLQLQVATS